MLDCQYKTLNLNCSPYRLTNEMDIWGIAPNFRANDVSFLTRWSFRRARSNEREAREYSIAREWIEEQAWAANTARHTRRTWSRCCWSLCRGIDGSRALCRTEPVLVRRIPPNSGTWKNPVSLVCLEVVCVLCRSTRSWSDRCSRVMRFEVSYSNESLINIMSCQNIKYDFNESKFVSCIFSYTKKWQKGLK